MDRPSKKELNKSFRCLRVNYGFYLNNYLVKACSRNNVSATYLLNTKSYTNDNWQRNERIQEAYIGTAEINQILSIPNIDSHLLLGFNLYNIFID